MNTYSQIRKYTTIKKILKYKLKNKKQYLEKNRNITSKFDLKKITIVRELIAVWIISILATLVIRTSGFITSNKTHGNLDEIYNIYFEKETQLASVNIMACDSNRQLTTLIEDINNISNSFNIVSTKVEKLGDNILQINKITDLINEIANQTNLLSLNISIEAARAEKSNELMNQINCFKLK